MSNIITQHLDQGKIRYINLDQYRRIDYDGTTYDLMSVKCSNNGIPIWYSEWEIKKATHPEFYAQIKKYLKQRTRII